MNNFVKGLCIKASFVTLFILLFAVFSCSHEPAAVADKNVQRDTLQSDFIFSTKNDSVIDNGEYIKYYKNGVMEMRGMMKNGKRDGVWKSWYESGLPWSETTFKEGVKNGKTITWYENETKRYEGFYTNDKESGKWLFWDESGKQQYSKDYK
jgi:hypothetical protein